MKLEVGKRYVRRDGKVTGPLKRSDNPTYPFYCEELKATWEVTGELFPPRSTPADLVAEYVEPQQPTATKSELPYPYSCSAAVQSSRNSIEPQQKTVAIDDSDERVVAAFNKLVRADRISYRFGEETSTDTFWSKATRHFIYKLNPSVKSIKLPDSGYVVEIDGENVKVGCQRFSINDLRSWLVQLRDYGGIISRANGSLFATREGIRHDGPSSHTITWNDADVLLKFLEEATK
jgi:hypothetical protein